MSQVREMLEVEGLARFVAVPRVEWCAAMRPTHEALIERIRPATDPKSFEEEVRTLELAFHGSFVDAYRNPVVAEMYRNIHKKMFLFRLIRRTAVNVENTIKAMEEHLAVIDAIAGGDGPAARRALEAHVRGVLHRVVYG
jgi:DNA-binding GntR family transcriptional regulator